jgi:hypothetical protein
MGALGEKISEGWVECEKRRQSSETVVQLLVLSGVQHAVKKPENPGEV